MNALVLFVSVWVGQIAPAAPESSPEEMLVQRIRENLARVDQLLLESADSESVAEGLGAATRAQEDVVRDLEELIKAVKYRPSSQSSSGGNSQSSGQSSSQPPPRESDGQSQGQQPDAGSQEDGADQPEPGGEEGEQESPQGQQPEDGTQESGTPQNRPGGPPPPDPLGSFTREDTDDRWGLLPPKLQERLLNLHVDDMPEQYRDWLEAYVKSMHRLESAHGR
jgi:hypothetical protein